MGSILYSEDRYPVYLGQDSFFGVNLYMVIVVKLFLDYIFKK